ncbi:hypothetical protein WAI453_007268 [Rhynchosporium graminicola]
MDTIFVISSKLSITFLWNSELFGILALRNPTLRTYDPTPFLLSEVSSQQSCPVTSQVFDRDNSSTTASDNIC